MHRLRIRDGELIGDPTEGALLVLATKGGLDPGGASRNAQPRIAEIPFDSAHKFMATFHHDGDTVRMFVKGAPDVLLARADRWLDAARRGSRSTTAARAASRPRTTRLAGQALRVLAVAGRVIPGAATSTRPGDLMALGRGAGP